MQFHILGIVLPSFAEQRNLLASVYTKIGLDPRQVSYLEAHGTATKAGDTVEANAVADVFCLPGRTGPLLIGSVKSNMGHTEPASGIFQFMFINIACGWCDLLSQKSEIISLNYDLLSHISDSKMIIS